MGDISKQEVKELNKVFESKTGYKFSKGAKEPASLFAWRYFSISALWVFGATFSCYAKFVRGYNILWFVAPFLPLNAFLLYNWGRQPP